MTSNQASEPERDLASSEIISDPCVPSRAVPFPEIPHLRGIRAALCWRGPARGRTWNGKSLESLLLRKPAAEFSRRGRGAQLDPRERALQTGGDEGSAAP